MRAYERLLNYVKVATASDDKSEATPTTKCQFDLANQLVKELKELGVEDASVDELCYVYGTLQATEGMEDKPKIGFIAHMDTAPDFCGENIKPQIIENYDGQDVVLGTSGRVLSVDTFPHLKKLTGRTLITTDGTTLLGSDDKSGIAEIMTVIEKIQNENIPHGTICIGFTPDEEVGAGADHFDVERFGAEFAYTVDGGEEGEIVYENFNAYEALFDINGFNVHPGSAKNTMINAQLVAMEINGMLPAAEVPEHTEGYEGFYHLCEMSGNVEKTHMEYIVRDHSSNMMEARLHTLRQIEKVINEKYGEGTVQLSIREEYRNMEEKIRPCFHIVETAKKVIDEMGIEPITVAERGGTDGARLSFMGLPCPNLGTGGYAFHGPYEHVTVEGMDKCVDIILGIIKEYAK
ncbi:peptidase T [Velocimicrobium porci]|uniref:Peptidase T n=1 Tax=Velocimicrobium porci TaxID=2606634 RepID=A0A6L5XY56_9FIRM|nr:peptidase T [Velocimicrobium porci]MSS63457.1 peptidase T [Velocimicrobium porci]